MRSLIRHPNWSWLQLVSLKKLLCTLTREVPQVCILQNALTTCHGSRQEKFKRLALHISLGDLYLLDAQIGFGDVLPNLKLLLRKPIAAEVFDPCFVGYWENPASILATVLARSDCSDVTSLVPIGLSLSRPGSM